MEFPGLPAPAKAVLAEPVNRLLDPADYGHVADNFRELVQDRFQNLEVPAVIRPGTRVVEEGKVFFPNPGVVLPTEKTVHGRLKFGKSGEVPGK